LAGFDWVRPGAPGQLWRRLRGARLGGQIGCDAKTSNGPSHPVGDGKHSRRRPVNRRVPMSDSSSNEWFFFVIPACCGIDTGSSRQDRCAAAVRAFPRREASRMRSCGSSSGPTDGRLRASPSARPATRGACLGSSMRSTPSRAGRRASQHR